MTARVRSVIWVSSLIILGAIIGPMLYLYHVSNRGEYFLPGVQIAGVSVTGCNVAQAAARVQKALNQAYTARVAFYYSDYTYNTSLALLTRPVVVKTKVEEIWKQEHTRDWKSKLLNLDGVHKVTYPINIEYDYARESAVMAVWLQHLPVQPVNARPVIANGKVIKVIAGRAGKIINKKSTLRQLPQRWQDVNGNMKIAIKLEDRPPAVDAEALNNLGELAEYSTWYNNGEVNRSINLSKATSKINDTLVLPGEIFSFNQTVGQRLVENGYRDAMIIVNGKFEPGLGGGVCQVSSTLYNTSLLAGMKIVERHNHALAVAYVPLGQDATVAYGSQDFKFKNNTAYPIYIMAAAAGGKLTVSIYGNLDYRQKIEITHVIDETLGYKTFSQSNLSLPPGTSKVSQKGMTGYVVRSYRTFCDKTGQVLKSELLSRDRYTPQDQIISVGPTAVQPSPPVENRPAAPSEPVSSANEPVTVSPPANGDANSAENSNSQN